MQKASTGRIVLYVLTNNDCLAINQRTASGELRGNAMQPGEILPLLVCRIWPEALYGKESINGQVMLDGAGSHWVTSCHPDAEKSHGTWHWPERVEAKPGGDSLSRMNAAMTKEQALLEKLEGRASHLCQLIESCGASPGLTTLSMQASQIRQVIACLVNGHPLPPYLEQWLEGHN